MDTTSERVTRLRLAIEQDLAVARDGFERALRADGPGVFVWHDAEFWIDRVRRMIVPSTAITAWRSQVTLPDDGEVGEARNVLEVYGGTARFENTGASLKLF